jgi:hypothetical protein
MVLLERSRRALAEIDGAIADARRASLPEDGVLALGYGPCKSDFLRHGRCA